MTTRINPAWPLKWLAPLLLFALVACSRTDGPYHTELFFQNNHWGYCIRHQVKTIIHQEYMPGAEGLAAFPNKETAARTAELVRNKLNRNENPMVTREELNFILRKYAPGVHH